MTDFKTNYPFIPNQNTYYVQDKLIYINSEDRNINKYPISSSFEILLPTDIINVATVQLKNWMVPTIYNTFSKKNNNLQLEFTLISIEYGKKVTDNDTVLTQEYIDNSNKLLNAKFIITITQGDYSPSELANEIQNRMNVAITNYLSAEYTFFKVIWNSVSKKFWFINTLHSFEFNNDSLLYLTNNLIGDIFNPCCNEKLYPSSYFGLPAYLGFNQIKESSIICKDASELTLMQNTYSGLPELSFPQNVVDGKPLNINFIIPISSYTLIKNPEIFLDIQSFNCVDETKPYTNNRFTQTTNQGNGNMNSFLGKIPMIATSNTFSSSNGGGDYQSKTNFNPPLEKVRKFSISMRHHDGSLVDFGFNNWSISLLLESYIPTQNTKITKTPF
jgi:uncharacterized membrane protein